MKFVRYVYRKFPICIGNFLYIYKTKYTLSWNKKRLQNKSKFPTYFVDFFVSTYSVVVARCYKKRFFSKRRRAHVVWKNIVYFVTLHDKYTVSWSNKACSKFPT